jgi:hypothetical protein
MFIHSIVYYTITRISYIILTIRLRALRAGADQEGMNGEVLVSTHLPNNLLKKPFFLWFDPFVPSLR